MLQAFFDIIVYNIDAYESRCKMKKEVRTIVYDEELHIKAYRLEGIVQPFPNHFHECYVFGYIEAGSRYLSCKGNDYILRKGHMVIFNVHDNHGCAQCGDEALDYRAINVPKEIIQSITFEITGLYEVPQFMKTVIMNEDAVSYLRSLHEMIVNKDVSLGKEEMFMLLISCLLQAYAQPFTYPKPSCTKEIEIACNFIKEHYMEAISLNQIGNVAHLSTSTLLRMFTKTKGVTPYQYLESIRIHKAKKFLEQGKMPIDVAMKVGFCDQSHFTKYFNRLIGLSPGMYRDIFMKGIHNEE